MPTQNSSITELPEVCPSTPAALAICFGSHWLSAHPKHLGLNSTNDVGQLCFLSLPFHLFTDILQQAVISALTDIWKAYPPLLSFAGINHLLSEVNWKVMLFVSDVQCFAVKLCNTCRLLSFSGSTSCLWCFSMKIRFGKLVPVFSEQLKCFDFYMKMNF